MRGSGFFSTLALVVLLSVPGRAGFFDRLLGSPSADTVEPDRYYHVSRIFIVGGESKFADASGSLVTELGRDLAAVGCWQVTVTTSPVEAPPPKSWDEASANVSSALPRAAREDAAVLVLWVTKWKGERFAPAPGLVEGLVGDYLEARLKQKNAARPTMGEYERESIAQLVDAQSGALIWRARKAYPSGTQLDDNGRLPVASEDVIEQQSKQELEDFGTFFARNLAQPGNLQRSCQRKR